MNGSWTATDTIRGARIPSSESISGLLTTSTLCRQANNVMRHFRSIYNVTAAAHDEFPPNPVNILTQARAWYPERRRRGAVSANDLPAWWAAVMEEPDYARDFLLIALFTGMRRNEIAALPFGE